MEEALNCIRTDAIADVSGWLHYVADVLKVLNRVFEKGGRDFCGFFLALGLCECQFREDFIELAHFLVLEIMVGEDLVCASEHGGTDAQVCHLALERTFLIGNFTSCCLRLRRAGSIFFCGRDHVAREVESDGIAVGRVVVQALRLA